jgi:cell division protein FtsL
MLKMFVMTAMAVGVTCVSVSAQSAQKINTDSLSLVSKISVDQLKLGKLQNSVEEITRDKQDYGTAAQQSADKNKTAAGRLSDDPTDKKEARKADIAASDARSNAKKARKASDKLKDLNDNISDLKEKIAQQQTKLNAFTPVVSVIMPVPVDSTLHN